MSAISNVKLGARRYLDTLHLIAFDGPLSFDISHDDETLHFDVIFDDTSDKVELISVSGVEGEPLHGLITFKNLNHLSSSTPTRELLMGILANRSLFMMCSVRQMPPNRDVNFREITMSFYLGGE